MNDLSPVDHLEVLVLVDNKTDSLSTVPACATLEWGNLRKAGMLQLSGDRQCCANHGLSLVVTARRGAGKRTVLFDAGPVDFAVEYNGSRLGLRFDEIEAIVLSHGHWDHAGGLPKALELITAGSDDRRVPCYLHPGMFRQRALPLPGGDLLPLEEIPTPDELGAHGGLPVVTDKPIHILDGMFSVSGEIPRVTPYEKGFPGHARRNQDGTGWEPDPLIMDERFLVAHVERKGLVIFSACSHAGIINVLSAARASFPDTPVHALVGGFHLSGANETVIDQTVADLGKFDVDLVMPGHCTGWRAVNALERSHGGKILPIAVGMSVEFGP